MGLAAATGPASKQRPASCILARVCGKPVLGTPRIVAPKAPLPGVRPGKDTLEGRWVQLVPQHPP